MIDMKNLDVIYADSEEKFVKTTVLYGKASDNYLYTSAASATAATEADRIDKDTLLEICKKGLIVSYGGTFYAPISFKDDTSESATAVTIATAVNASTSTSVTLYSKEYTAD